MTNAALIRSLGVALLTLAPLASCGGGGEGAEETPSAITEDDRAEILAELTASSSSLVAAIFSSLVFAPVPSQHTTTKATQPKAAVSCSTEGATCSCTYGGEIVHCHVTIDQQELCDVSGSKWITGNIDATGSPGGGSVVGDAKLVLGPPPCVVSTDGLTIEGTLALSVSAQGSGDVFHATIRLFSSGLTAVRNGKVVGVCVIDVTATESGVSGTMCGVSLSPTPPKAATTDHSTK